MNPKTRDSADRPVEMWTVYEPNGRRSTICTYYSRESAERQLAEWRVREARGGRPDVTTEGMYVAPVTTPVQPVRPAP